MKLSVRDRESILNRQHEIKLALRPLQKFLLVVRKELGIEKAELTICLVSDAEIAKMNEVFRKKKGPTDVLSFPIEKREGYRRRKSSLWRKKVAVALGDIAISPQTAKRYAKKHARTLPSELRVLILHGVLHLLGYDHETDRGEMDQIEGRLRKRFGLA